MLNLDLHYIILQRSNLFHRFSFTAQLLKNAESVSSVSNTRLVPLCLCFTCRVSSDRELFSIFRKKGFIFHNITLSVTENVNLRIHKTHFVYGNNISNTFFRSFNLRVRCSLVLCFPVEENEKPAYSQQRCPIQSN